MISRKFMSYEFDILSGILRFNPVVNTRLSYIGNFFDPLSNPFLTILLNVFALGILISGYLLYKVKRENTSFPVKIIMIFGLAGCLCSLIDKLFWGGSLDFLQIPNFFIFDLKDCYITMAGIPFVILGISHSQEISVKEYLRFCWNKFKL